MKPVAVLYENDAWMAPVFAALEAAGIPYERVFANAQAFDPSADAPAWSLAVNKVSPSSYLRGHAPSIAFARQFLPFLEERGIPVVNGSEAFRLETSKALQLLLLRRLGIRAPSAHVVNDPSRVVDAARGLRPPFMVKPNIGGSGALMRRFASLEELEAAVPTLDLGPDGTALVQEYLEPIDGSIIRVEFLDGRFLYAIRISNESATDFNLCPADICQVPGEVSLGMELGAMALEAGDPASGSPSTSDFDKCVVDAPAKKSMRIERFDPPAEMVEAVLRIAGAGKLDVGGVEYLVAGRDGRPYVYDINALSNFVTDATSLVGFDPHQRFARYLGERAGAEAVA